jgi:hypothetical protein
MAVALANGTRHPGRREAFSNGGNHVGKALANVFRTNGFGTPKTSENAAHRNVRLHLSQFLPLRAPPACVTCPALGIPCSIRVRPFPSPYAVCPTPYRRACLQTRQRGIPEQSCFSRNIPLALAIRPVPSSSCVV